MKILVACEYSATVRNALIRRGHNAISCDYLPSDDGAPHYQGDVRDILDCQWDGMIAHPPCTYLCSSGLHWNARRPERRAMTDDAVEFVKMLANAPIKRIAIENPIGCLSSRWRKPDQIIQPWQFGHPDSKATCLWLKGLNPLVPTNVLRMPECGHWMNQTPSGQNRIVPSPDRWKIRSKTYEGIALAIASQWFTEEIEK